MLNKKYGGERQGVVTVDNGGVGLKRPRFVSGTLGGLVCQAASLRGWFYRTRVSGWCVLIGWNVWKIQCCIVCGV